jgi:nanoRNase/pAp phosphatase (c-di-AMP/oligoRNAs hydrolase)
MIDKDPLSIELFAQSLDEGQGYHRIVTEGTAMQRYADSLVREQAGRAIPMTLAGYEVPVVNTTTLFSEVGDYLCQKHPAAPFVAYYFDRHDQRQWGLRSRGGFDCSVVAQTFGGGGHPGAAGFVTAKGWLP